MLLHLLIIAFLYQNADGLLQNIDALDNPLRAVLHLHDISEAWQVFIQIFISLLLIFQAAHKPAADAGYLRRIQGQVLLLCHFDGYRGEIGEIGMTAQRTAADSYSSQQLCLIPDANLPEFDSGLEYCRQFPNQLPEIHPSIRGKVKKKLFVIKRIFRLNQFHVQMQFPYFLLADSVGFLLFHPVGLFPGNILFRSHADNLSQRLHHLLLRNLMRAQDHAAAFQTAGGLHNHTVAHVRVVILRIKIINLSAAAETYTNDCYHIFCIFLFHRFCSGAFLLHLNIINMGAENSQFSLMVRNSSSIVRSKLTFARSRSAAT